MRNLSAVCAGADVNQFVTHDDNAGVILLDGNVFGVGIIEGLEVSEASCSKAMRGMVVAGSQFTVTVCRDLIFVEQSEIWYKKLKFMTRCPDALYICKNVRHDLVARSIT